MKTQIVVEIDQQGDGKAKCGTYAEVPSALDSVPPVALMQFARNVAKAVFGQITGKAKLAGITYQISFSAQ